MKKYIEVLLLTIASWILSRYLKENNYLSKKDSNYLFSSSELTRKIANRVRNDYSDTNANGYNTVVIHADDYDKYLNYIVVSQEILKLYNEDDIYMVTPIGYWPYFKKLKEINAGNIRRS